MSSKQSLVVPTEDQSKFDFKQVLASLKMPIIILDEAWQIVFANQSSETYIPSACEHDLFWDALESKFGSCLKSAYQRALLGDLNQLDESSSTDVPDDIYDGVPPKMIEQKAVDFEFHCEPNDRTFSVGLQNVDGLFIMRIQDITRKELARIQAERNREELEQTLDEIKQARNANPLTGLPGNIRIKEEIKRRLRNNHTFALIYADLDHFKPFNDKYGFERGNDVILLLKEVLQEKLEEIPVRHGFLGHIGGDDFVVLISAENHREFCQEVIDEFDERIPDMYDQNDREQGIVTENRRGEQQHFPMMTLSLAVVTNIDREFENELAMSEAAAEVKKYVKENRAESNYMVDRRSD